MAFSMLTVDLLIITQLLAMNPPPCFPAVAFRMMSLDPFHTVRSFSASKPPPSPDTARLLNMLIVEFRSILNLSKGNETSSGVLGSHILKADN